MVSGGGGGGGGGVEYFIPHAVDINLDAGE